MGAACSTTPNDHHSFDDLLVSPLRIRRPKGPPADPRAPPAGEDYQSNPLPGPRFDCKKPEVLVKKINLARVRACIEELNAPVKLKKDEEPPRRKFQYRFQRIFQPELTLVEPEKAPACLREFLPKIPVPRELFFMKKIRDQYECYATRVPIEADKWLGMVLPKDRFNLKVDFPMPAPKTDKETKRMLLAWALTPFLWSTDNRKIDALYVPKRICEVCYGREYVLKDEDLLPPKWP